MTEVVRLRDGHVYTPLRTYVHPDAGRRVTLVGTVRLAEHERDAVMVWGVAHLLGFGKDLLRRGFIQTGESWHRAFRLPSVAAAIWGIVGGGRGALAPIGHRAGVR